MKQNNLFYLIGHPGAGKSTIARHTKNYFNKTNTKQKIVVLDEDEMVVENIRTFLTSKGKIDSGRKIDFGYICSLFKDPTKLTIFLEKFYAETRFEILETAHSEIDIIFLISTGGFSPLFDKKAYVAGHPILISVNFDDFEKSINDRLKCNQIVEVLNFDENKNVCGREKLTNANIEHFYNISMEIYKEVADKNILYNTHKENPEREIQIKSIIEQLLNIIYSKLKGD